MSPIFRRRAVSAAAFLLAGGAAFAQTSAPATDATPAPSTTLKEVVVTGNPLGSDTVVAPVTSLSGDDLAVRAGTTLGATLDGTPGVSATYFGPNASRPIIRGQDGDRIRVLQNGGASLDASALSYDHAVPSDPLSIDRIEVLRGPAALLYGGSAVGGVVNVIDNRIPREPIGGVTGRADVGLATGNRERSGAVVVEGGTDRFAIHADAFDRTTDDVYVPTLLPCAKPGSASPSDHICNSASQTHGGSLGGTMFFDHGYLGASVTGYRSTYGTVAEDDVTIGMRQNRYALDGEWRDLGGPFASVRFKASRSDYQHTEYESGAAGTTFRNAGNDMRIEARQARWGSLDGVVGLQAETSRFSADGDEAFAPYSRTRSVALFAHEELKTGWGQWSFGARRESVNVQSLGNPDPALARFVPGERKFDPTSFAGGAVWNVAPAWQLTTNLAHTERAPKDYELFANGPHVATAAWETGDPNLGKEKSNSLDFGAAWKDGANRFAVTAYAARFANYIGLVGTGNRYGADGELNPVDADNNGIADGSGEEIFGEQAYRGVRARFQGLEASGNVRLLDTAQKVDLEMRGDLVRAVNSDTGAPLPRIAPMRLGATLVFTQGPFNLRFGFDHMAAQNRVAPGDRPTDAYTLWNASAGYRQNVGKASVLWYARLDNLTNQLAYSATSILTTTAFPKAPLPGRSLKVGMRVDF